MVARHEEATIMGYTIHYTGDNARSNARKDAQEWFGAKYEKVTGQLVGMRYDHAMFILSFGGIAGFPAKVMWEDAMQKWFPAIDGHHGVYVPMEFAASFADDIDVDDREILLAGPDHEWYWETWDKVSQGMVQGHHIHIGESGDVFLLTPAQWEFYCDGQE